MFGMIKAFWQEFTRAYRAEREGGQAAIESRQREADMRREWAEEREAHKIAKEWVRADTPGKQKAAVDDVKKFVLGDDSDK